MSTTTTVTTSYTSDINVNGTANVTALYSSTDSLPIKRVKVNGTDVIHKFTRTVVRANSNLTFTFTVRFKVSESTACGYTDYYFYTPIYVDVTVTDNSSSGFTSLTGVATELLFYCPEGDMYSSADERHYYRLSMGAQSFTIGQQKTLTFSSINGKAIWYEKDTPSEGPNMMYIDLYGWTDPDGVGGNADVWINPLSLPAVDHWYNQTYARNRVVSNQVLSDNTVQEY